jgi:hypothetical protein
MVIERGLAATIRQTTGQNEVMIISGDLERTRDTGMIVSLIAETKADSYRQQQSWQIESDRWGQICRMTRLNGPLYFEIKPTKSETDTDLKPKPESEGVLVLGVGEVIFDDDRPQAYRTRNTTTICIDSTRRNWME